MDNVDQLPPFGTWLLGEDKSGRWWSTLAKAAKADRGFPKSGNPEQVRKRLEASGAEPDMLEMLDDAESAWAAAG